MTNREHFNNTTTEEFIKEVGGEDFEFCDFCCQTKGSDFCLEKRCIENIDKWLDSEYKG